MFTDVSEAINHTRDFVCFKVVFLFGFVLGPHPAVLGIEIQGSYTQNMYTSPLSSFPATILSFNLPLHTDVSWNTQVSLMEGVKTSYCREAKHQVVLM